MNKARPRDPVVGRDNMVWAGARASSRPGHAYISQNCTTEVDFYLQRLTLSLHCKFQTAATALSLRPIMNADARGAQF
jgi:hypothetical protein